MYTAKLSIKQTAMINYHTHQETALDILYSLIGYFINNGQMTDSHNHPHFIEQDYICIIVNIFNHDSLDQQYHNIYIKNTLSKLKSDDFRIDILGKELESPDIATPDETEALILTTRCYSQQSPVKSFEFNPIPIHYLPKTYHDHEEYHNLICWQRDFQACDSLQIRCTVGETWALNQMGDIHSELSQQGLEICKILMEKLRKPVYYDLYQYYILDDEAHRKCPKCGGEWRLIEPLHEQYDFKCDKCYLLSNLGLSEKD
ncbi:DUF2310 family Zn-ribbon-containing protein [Moraxella sp. ZY210820]|uniref:DUF2310 family Zn-ribbon-containing protein n=1 Tax=unclassified Moraxella TaxID=2685852 RepID=UPI0027322490|nr:DUF2310 family Zn-ribbon-containing protein [Moraxella sp. ZY210820]WLF83377.1 Zn-ribbon-containing protein [Moraxella sp. ZY210820]